MQSPEDKPTDQQVSDAVTPSLVVAGAGLSATYPLGKKGTLAIGRSTETDVPVDDASVSRNHALLHLGANFMIEDKGSLNGTWINNARLAPGAPTVVRPGDVIRVGDVALLIKQPRPTKAAPASSVVIESESMRRLYGFVDRVASSTINVVLLGETGVGKEVVARAVHERSSRARGPFVGVNCGALSESLLESELFGYEKGAFSGAQQIKRGLVESANEGTLFLDEIGEFPLAAQVKLLRVLELRQVLRVGAVKPLDVDIRVIAATNRDLEAEMAAGRLRSDLYFRLNGFTLVIPPLRERKDEIEPLVAQYLRVFAAEVGYPAPPELTAPAREVLAHYRWPGNVRELRNVVQRAVLLSGGGAIRVDHLPAALTASGGSAVAGPLADTNAVTASTGLRADVQREVEALEKQRIVAALESCGGNQTHAAKALGISRRSLIDKMERYALPRPRKSPGA